MTARFIIPAALILLPAALWAEDTRVHFAYRTGEGAGYFKRNGEDTWIEHLASGGTNTFKETAREKDYIEIYDSTRGEVWVRMHATQSYWKHPEQTGGEWRTLWTGAWDYRVHFAYRTGDGSGYFKTSGKETWTEHLASGGTNTFKETAREKDYIEIFDSTREVGVRMYAKESHWKHPESTSGEWRTLWAGAWVSDDQEFQVHALLVIDTAAEEKEKIGLAIAGDRMAALLESLPDSDKSRLRVTQLRGDDVTPATIREYYRRLESKPLDVLFFYYMGHGGVEGNRDNGRFKNGTPIPIDFGAYSSKTGIFSGFPESSDPTYHRLALEHGWINRLEIYDLMLACPSRACIIFADCCGNFVFGREGRHEGPPPEPDTAARFAARLRNVSPSDIVLSEPGKINPELWEKLFYEHMGLIDLAGAPVGYFGLSNTRYGGLSSFAFTELLCASNDTIIAIADKNTNWPETNGLPGWMIFQSYVLTPQYCSAFQQIRSERIPAGEEEKIHSFGPRLFDPMYQIYETPQMRQMPGGSAVIGLMPKSGVVCRIQPGGGIPAGFYFVNSCEGQSPNYSNATQIFNKIVGRQVRSIQIAQNPPVPTQRQGPRYDVPINAPR